MTRIMCAATACTHNDGGICSQERVSFTFIGGSDVNMACEEFTPRQPGDAKSWRGDTNAYDNRKKERSESVGSSHQL